MPTLTTAEVQAHASDPALAAALSVGDDVVTDQEMCP